MGNLLQSDDTLAGLGVSTFQYDPMDRLVEKTTVAGVVAYEYDLSGMKTRVTDPNSEATTHAYDEAGRLIRATVLDTPNRENYFHHDRSGLIERKVLAGNKVVSYFAYDVAGRLSSLVNRDDAAAVISSFAYQRNPIGAVTQVEHEDGEFTYYAYDALDRLVEERRVQNPTVYGFAYEYDAASNRVQKVDLVEDETTNYTVDARNLIQSEVTGADEIAYEYDQAQRMKRRASADKATVFTHNQRDLPTKVEFEVESGTPDPNQDFHYTGTGERAVMVSSSFGPTLLAYDGTRLLLEKFAGGGTFGKYRWAGGAPIETYDGEFSATGTPVLDERGSVERQGGLSGRVIYDRFGVEWANDLVGTTRTRFFSPVFLRLGTSERLSLTRAGVYLTSLARLTGGPRGRILGGYGLGLLVAAIPPLVGGGLEGQQQPPPREDPRDGQAPVATPGEELGNGCEAGVPVLWAGGQAVGGLDAASGNVAFSSSIDQFRTIRTELARSHREFLIKRGASEAQVRGDPRAAPPPAQILDALTRLKGHRTGPFMFGQQQTGGFLFFIEFPVRTRAPELDCRLQVQEDVQESQFNLPGALPALVSRKFMETNTQGNIPFTVASRSSVPGFDRALIYADIPTVHLGGLHAVNLKLQHRVNLLNSRGDYRATYLLEFLHLHLERAPFVPPRMIPVRLAQPEFRPGSGSLVTTQPPRPTVESFLGRPIPSGEVPHE